MNRTEFDRSLDQATLVLIQALVDKIRPEMESGEPSREKLLELVRRTQQLAMECRLLYGRAREDTSREECRDKLNAMGYSLEWEGTGVRIELPLLLPKRGTDAAFITAPLHELLSLEVGACREKYRECVVVFRHIYGGDKRPHDIRDFDNVESRAILNVIERFFLTSDSALYCGSVQVIGTGRTSKTVITLLPGKLDLMAVKRAVSL